MKKLLIGSLVLVTVVILASYVIIPSKIKVSSITIANANDIAAHRVLMDEGNWAKWWPNKKAFQLDETRFWLTQKMLNSFDLMIYNEGDSVNSQLQLILVNTDSVNLVWSFEIASGNNPMKRFSHYYAATAIKKKLDFLLDSLAAYLSDKRNIYGFDVKKVLVTDSVLISTRKTFDHYPDEFETEEMIKRLRAYISINKAKEMNFPMLHVKQMDSIHFEAMTAIATDFKLPDNNEFAAKMLLKGGNLLEGEVKGGHATITKSFDEFEKLIKDYRKTSPAIPYQLMITDRTKEMDTTKWVTKLCYPIL